MSGYKAAVVTVSDKGAAGLREDTGGPLVCSMLSESGYDVVQTSIVPDERPEIEAELIRLCEDGGIALVVTTGGTGFSPRDVTPEATNAVCERLCPGIPEAMRAASMAHTDRAMLSRMSAGIRNLTLIVNVPGSPKAIRENLEAVLAAIAHGLIMLREPQQDHA